MAGRLIKLPMLGQYHPEAIVGIHIKGIQRNGLLQGFNGFLCVTRFFERPAQVVIAGGVAGVDGQLSEDLIRLNGSALFFHLPVREYFIIKNKRLTAVLIQNALKPLLLRW